MIRIEPLTSVEDYTGRRVTSWTWRCDCHGAVSPLPWPEKPSEANAAAEHEFATRRTTVAAAMRRSAVSGGGWVSSCSNGAGADWPQQLRWQSCGAIRGSSL